MSKEEANKLRTYGLENVNRKIKKQLSLRKFGYIDSTTDHNSKKMNKFKEG